MGPNVRGEGPALVHDLIRIQKPAAVTAEWSVPSWVEAALSRTPWVVVRRGRIQGGEIPVGVRGPARSQRFPAWLLVADVAERRSPEELWDNVEGRPTPGLAHDPGRARMEAVPALGALTRVAPLLASRGYCWGPGGSVGFELATAEAAATASSDLDVILRCPRRLEPGEARDLQAALVEAAAPTRIDALLETPRGGVLLADWAASPIQVLVRTEDGPQLLVDPWIADAEAATEGDL